MFYWRIVHRIIFYQSVTTGADAEANGRPLRTPFVFVYLLLRFVDFVAISVLLSLSLVTKFVSIKFCDVCIVLK